MVEGTIVPTLAPTNEAGVKMEGEVPLEDLVSFTK